MIIKEMKTERIYWRRPEQLYFVGHTIGFMTRQNVNIYQESFYSILINFLMT